MPEMLIMLNILFVCIFHVCTRHGEQVASQPLGKTAIPATLPETSLYVLIRLLLLVFHTFIVASELAVATWFSLIRAIAFTRELCPVMFLTAVIVDALKFMDCKIPELKPSHTV
jgi:hypothetical protein